MQIACLLICVHTFANGSTKENIGHILIINAYTESRPWSNSLIYPIVHMASQNKEGDYLRHYPN